MIFHSLPHRKLDPVGSTLPFKAAFSSVGWLCLRNLPSSDFLPLALVLRILEENLPPSPQPPKGDNHTYLQFLMKRQSLTDQSIREDPGFLNAFFKAR